MSGSERRRYEVNGQVYDSLDEMPPEVRSVVASIMADHDGDGVPDILAAGDGSATITSHTSSYVVDGVSYESIDDVPEPHRAHLRQLEGGSGAGMTTTPAAPPAVAQSTGAPSPIVQRAGMSSRTKLLIAFAVIDAAAVGVIAWLLLR